MNVHGVRRYVEEFQFAEYLRFDFTHLKGDLIGGVTSAVVALPLALGFGILAYGGDPRGAVAGLYGAIFTGLLASLFGGTERQITGPTGGMTVILTMVYKEFGGPEALLGACIIAGILQIGFGFVKAGRFISFIPYPVIVGFTNGIALLIFGQQLHLFAAAPMIGLITIGTIALIPLVHRSLPKALIGLVVGTLVAIAGYDRWDWLRIAVDPTRYALVWNSALQVIGTIPQTFAAPAFPSVGWNVWSKLFPAGLTISLLGSLETLLASVVADSATGDRHNSNRELVGQGIGNLVAGIFGGIAGTGAIVRTNVNIRSGGVTKISGIVHSVVLIAMMMVLAPLVARVPLVVLAGVLMMTAVGMFEWEPLRRLPRTPLPDALVMVATMVITVLSDLITAVLVGFALAGFLFVFRMSELGVTNILDEKQSGNLSDDLVGRLKQQRIVVYEIEGPLFFGAAKNFVREIEQQFNYSIIILAMENVPIIDATGALALEDIVDRLARDKKKLILAGLRKEARTVLHKMGVTSKIGIGNFAMDTAHAIEYALRYSDGAWREQHLGRYLSPDLILLDIAVASKEELFTRMAERAYRKGYVTNKAEFLRDLWEREESASTGMERSIAIPHSRSGSTGSPVIIVARLAGPIPYETMDGSDVRLVFMISASYSNEEYLQILSLLGKRLKQEGIVASLLEAHDEHEMFDVLSLLGGGTAAKR